MSLKTLTNHLVNYPACLQRIHWWWLIITLMICPFANQKLAWLAIWSAFTDSLGESHGNKRKAPCNMWVSGPWRAGQEEPTGKE